MQIIDISSFNLLLRDVFIDGLQDRLKTHLQLHQPTTYQEAVKLSRVRDSIKNEQDQYAGDMKKVLKLLEDQKPNKNASKSSYIFLKRRTILISGR